MEQIIDFVPMMVFMAVGTVAVAASILVIALRNPVNSAMFLLLTFLCVAVLFILAHAEFVGAVQLLVYAGGIMVLFLFVVMLTNLGQLRDEPMISPYWKGAIGVGIALFILFTSIVRTGAYADPAPSTDPLRESYELRTRTVETPAGPVKRPVMRRGLTGNSEAVGMALYQEYLVPFEVASLFLLVAMIGAIVFGKRHLALAEEETTPQFILDRAAAEKREKEAMRA